MNFVNAMGHTGMTYTENDAITPSNTGNAIIDFFFHSAAMREADVNHLKKILKLHFVFYFMYEM